MTLLWLSLIPAWLFTAWLVGSVARSGGRPLKGYWG